MQKHRKQNYAKKLFEVMYGINNRIINRQSVNILFLNQEKTNIIISKDCILLY